MMHFLGLQTLNHVGKLSGQRFPHYSVFPAVFGDVASSETRPGPVDPVAAGELTAVGVDVVGLQEADLEVVQDGRLVQVAEGREVVLAHQDVRVPQEGERVFRTDAVLQRLNGKR